jgi:Phosphatidylinositol 3- and 4-kinase
VAHVSEWMFLSWIPQIMSHFDFKSPCYLDSLLLRLSTVYPNAMIFPFGLALRQFQQLSPSAESRIKREGVAEITKSFTNPILFQMIEALSYVCLPCTLLTHHVTKLLQGLAHQLGWDTFKRDLEILLEVCYGRNEQGTEMEKIKKFRDQLVGLRSVKDRQQAHQTLSTIFTECEKMRNSERRSQIDTKKINPWLAKYQWHGKDQFLEVPGQYDHLYHRPDVESHVKIVKFGSHFELFQSKRMPMKMAIYGSDGRVYYFVVKLGEDLRLDQRIQQLLHTMNRQLLAHKQCKAQNLSITTYTVEPLTGYMGLLRFVDDTEPMNKFLCAYFCKQKGDFIKQNNEVRRKYKEFLEQGQVRQASDRDTYGKTVEQLTPVRVNFNSFLVLVYINTHISFPDPGQLP